MNHKDKRLYLIRQLLSEHPELQNFIIPEGDREQKDLKMLRAGIKAEFNSHMDQ